MSEPTPTEKGGSTRSLDLSQGESLKMVGGLPVKPARGGNEFRTRWLYWWIFTWAACSGRFMSLYYFDEGLSPSEIGAVFAMSSASGPIMSTAIGIFADRWALRQPAARHWCLAISVVCGTIAFTLQAVHFTNISRFTVMLVCGMFRSGFSSAVGIMSDAITVLGLVDRKRFGQERLYGAVSWAIMHVALGILIDRYGRMVQHVLIIFNAVGLVAVTLTLGVPGPPAESIEESATPSKTKPVGLAALSDRHALGALLRTYAGSKLTMAFFFYAMALGYGMAIVENLVFLFFRELGASYFLCGISVVVTVMFEVPLFSKSKYLLDTFGTETLMVAAGLCYSFRVIGYTFCPSGWYVLLFEPMHGVTIATWSTASVEFVAGITPAAFAATGQAFIGVLRSLGSAAGTSVGGAIINEFGENACYRVSATIVTVGLLVYIGAWSQTPKASFAPMEDVEDAEPHCGHGGSTTPPDKVGQAA